MFEILYQDEYLIAINKPAGWLVHRSWLDRHETVVVMQTLRDQIGQHVFPVHRLDRPTSGVLLFALSSEVANKMMTQFVERSPSKTYHAIVRGYIETAGHIDYPLKLERDKIADKYANSDDKIQEAQTDYEPISIIELPIPNGRFSTSRFSYIKLTPHTGRKHQLRRHMKHIFHPIIGDSRYGDLVQNRLFSEHFNCKRLFLNASELTFIHPITQELISITAQMESLWSDIVSEFNQILKV